MKIICPGHYCVLEDEDKHALENNRGVVQGIAYECPFCKTELRILNILAANVRDSAVVPAEL